MSAPTYEEMEAKRQEMIASFREIAAAMTRCVQVIEDYTALSPNHLSKPDFSVSSLAHPMSILPNGHLVADVLKKERKKKEKKPRDPNAPKRPPSAYILFQNEIRDDVRNSNPGMSYKDILGVISQKWKELTDAQKKIYEEAYSNAHNNYVAEEKAYSAKPLLDITPAIDPALTDETSDDSDSDSDATPPTKHKAPTTIIPLSHPNHFLTNPALQVPPTTLHAATAGVPMSAPVAKEKKEKKRKNKDELPGAVAADAADKKKKKKSKE